MKVPGDEKDVNEAEDRALRKAARALAEVSRKDPWIRQFFEEAKKFPGKSEPDIPEED